MKNFLFLLFLGFTNILWSQNLLTVNPSLPVSSTNYDKIQDAIDAASANDIIQIYPGNYNESITLNKKLTLVGPGYFHLFNELAVNTILNHAIIQPTFTVAAQGGQSLIMGLFFNDLRLLSTNGVVIRRNYIQKMRIDDCTSPFLEGNFFGDDSHSYVNQSASLLFFNMNSDIQVSNNIFNFQSTSNSYFNIYSPSTFTVSGVFKNNVFNDKVDLGTNAATFLNNIFTGNSSGDGTLDLNDGSLIEHNLFAYFNPLVNASGLNNQMSIDMSNVFVGYPIQGTHSFDSRYQLKANSPAIGYGLNGENCGPFGGDAPYKLSGIPDFPFVYELIVPSSGTTGSGIDVTIKVRTENLNPMKQQFLPIIIFLIVSLSILKTSAQPCPTSIDCFGLYQSYEENGNCDNTCDFIYQNEYGHLRIPVKSYFLGPEVNVTSTQIDQFLSNISFFFQNQGFDVELYNSAVVPESSMDFLDFCGMSEHPNCPCTDGGDDLAAIVDSTANNLDVLNIYIVDTIIIYDEVMGVCKNIRENGGGGSYFPGDGTAAGSNGIFLKQRIVHQDIYAVFAHELAHQFGLFHTFQSSAFLPSCSDPLCKIQDGIEDTPEDSSGVATPTDNLMDYNEEFTDPSLCPYVDITNCQVAKMYAILYNCRSNLCVKPEQPDVQDKTGLSIGTLTFNRDEPLDTIFSFLTGANRTHTSNDANWYCQNPWTGVFYELTNDSLDLNLLEQNNVIDRPGTYTVEVRDKGIFNDECKSDPVYITVEILPCNYDGICDPVENITNCSDCNFTPGVPLPLVTELEYFIDTDPGFGNGTPITISTATSLDISLNIDLSAVSPGLHTLFVRAKDDESSWSFIQRKSFYVFVGSGGANSLTAMEYFIDTDPGLGSGTALTLNGGSVSEAIYNIDLASITPGLHTFFVRAQDNYGQWSFVQRKTFYVFNGSGNNLLTNLEYFIDTDPGYGSATTLPLNGNPVSEATYNINLAAVPVGLHTLFVRGQDGEGQWSFIQRKTFYVFEGGGGNKEIVELEYFFGTDPGLGMANQINIAPANMIDVTETIEAPANSGQHQFNVRAKDNWGRWSFLVNDTIDLTPGPPDCTKLSEPLHKTVHVAVDTDLSWETSLGLPTGYKLTVGTTPGGNELIDNMDLGLVTTYDIGTMPAGSHIYPTITPYNGQGDAAACPEEYFITECVSFSTNTWMGGIALWNGLLNWTSSCIPTPCNDVIISAGNVTVPVGATAHCKTLDVKLGAVFEVPLGAELIVE